MSSRLGPLQVECDAPPYPVVCACRKLGLEAPEDVRWVRRDHLHQRWEALTSLFGPGAWGRVFKGIEAPAITCSCGELLPGLDACSFLFADGTTREYRLGQCRRCHTIFWEES